jgi:O-antigen/teichoic acid export membrane protein
MWYKLSNQTQYGAMFAIFGAAMTIFFNILLVPEMGYKGAAWATLICYSAMMLASYFIGQKKFYIPYQTKRMLVIMLLSIVLFFVSDLMKSFTGAQAGVVINTLLLGFFVYVLYKLEKPPLPWK